MLIFEHDTKDKDCIFNPTSETKNYLIGFFGFFSHSLHENFYSFLQSLDILAIAGTDDISYSEFYLNSQYAIETYNCCDRRTFDLTIILPHSFTTKEEALNWFTDKIVTTKKLLETNFSEINVIDGDKFLEYLKKIEDYKQKNEFISDIIKYDLNNMIIELENKLLKDHEHDPDYTKIIKSKIKDYQDSIKRIS